MWFTGSQNPSKTKDAQHAGMELPAPVKNRAFITYFGSITGSVGGSLWKTDEEEISHEKFLQRFRGWYKFISKDDVDFGEDWLSTLAYITDDKRTDRPFLNSGMEFLDAFAMLFERATEDGKCSPKISESFDQEVKEAESYSPYGIEFKIGLTISDASNEVQRIGDVAESFEKPLMPRDLAHMKRLSDIVSLIKGYKTTIKTWKKDRRQNIVDVYLSQAQNVTLEEVASAAILLGRSKQGATQARDPSLVVNNLLKDYTELTRDYGGRLNFEGESSFSITNPVSSIRRYALYSALTGKNTKEIVERLGQNARVLQTLVGSSDTKKILAARAVKDLAIVADFIAQYCPKIDRPDQLGAMDAGQILHRNLQILKESYGNEKSLPGFGGDYEHRLSMFI